MGKETVKKNLKWKPHVRRCYALYIVCLFLLSASVICLIWPCAIVGVKNKLCGYINNCQIPWMKNMFVVFRGLVHSIVSYLQCVMDKDGIKAVISAIGIYAVAFAWLVSVQQQKVYGVSIGRLLRWAYPGFYRFYFLIFIGMDLVGIYAASVTGRRCAAAFASIGIGLGVIYSIWVCYRFVLDLEARSRIAEAYHYSQITLTENRKEKPQNIPMWIYIITSGLFCNRHPDECQAGGFQDKELKRKIEESVTLLGHMMADKEKNVEWIHISEVLALWCKAYTSYKSLTAVGEIQPENMNELCRLAERFWQQAIPKEINLNAQTKLTGIVIKECHSCDEMEKDIEAIDCLMAGFLLAVCNEEEGMQGRRFKVILPRITREEQHIMQEKERKKIFYLYEELALGYLWMNTMISGVIGWQLKTFYKNEKYFKWGKNGLEIQNAKERMEKFLIMIDNAFAECRGLSKNDWITKAEDENLLGESLQIINSRNNRFK